MTADMTAFVDRVKALGGTICLRGEDLHLQVPKQAMTPEFRARLAAAKPALVAHLSRLPNTPMRPPVEAAAKDACDQIKREFALWLRTTFPDNVYREAAQSATATWIEAYLNGDAETLAAEIAIYGEAIVAATQGRMPVHLREVGYGFCWCGLLVGQFETRCEECRGDHGA